MERLVGALDHPDPQVRQIADRSLRSLDGAARDRLCAAWAETRDARLGRIVSECAYVADGPMQVRLLSALQAGKQLALDEAEGVHELIRRLDEADASLREGVEGALRRLHGPAAGDAACRASLENPGERLATICLEQSYRPSDPGDAAVFLIANRQIDAYFEEHDGLGDLRAGYGRASDAIRSRLMQVARAGDARLLDFVLRPRLSLRQCSGEEIDAAVESSIQRQDWARLLADCQALPLAHSLKGWQALAASGWLPGDAHEAALLKQVALIFADPAGAVVKVPPPPKGTSAAFERWLAEGRSPELAAQGEEQLLERLKSAAPLAAVPLVAALAAKGTVSQAVRDAVQSSQHWLVRLAGHVTGLSGGLSGSIDPSKDDNYWVREVAGAGAVWTFWPDNPTPTQLEELDRAPREALLGASGSVRRLLRAVLARSLTGLTAERDAVAPDEDAIEITGFESRPL